MTFIEATTALLIMGALLGIVVPSFLGASVHSEDQTAQLNLRRAHAAAMILLVDHGTYAHADAAGMAAVEPNLNYVDSSDEASSGSGDSEQIAVHASGNGTVWAAAALSDSGTCWLIRDQVSGSRSSGGSPGLRFGSVSDAGQCDGEFAADPANTNGAGW